jgi:hypothetical protein
MANLINIVSAGEKTNELSNTKHIGIQWLKNHQNGLFSVNFFPDGLCLFRPQHPHLGDFVEPSAESHQV